MSQGSRLLDGARHVTAILGPTNTGKTHRAIERMLHHRSGMIGLPLRLLAREVYDRVVAARGPDVVALVTGEEKVIPKDPRYFVCTVEAMPIDRPVAFLAVDEVQLAGDRNRGHVFTDRLLHARGVLETMFLGSDTIEPLLLELVPDAKVERQPRLSKLTHTGTVKLAAVPRRSAVVAFGAEQVYAHAERLRGLHGGAAVVLGALSPRTRNAQVAMYQAGEVQHLVATDAIGMGLNMDVRHVAFTATRKYDGRSMRALSAAEVAQIAGRAGRWTTDGTFGTTREEGDLDPALVDAVEHHAFAPLTRLFWRNTSIDLSSPTRLLASLRRPAPHPALIAVRDEDDEVALEALVARGDLKADHPDAVRLLWEVCRIPDYRKTLTGSHVELLHAVAGQLLARGRLDDDWVSKRIERLDVSEGDIETLMTRIAYVRTWTYVSHQRDWLADPAHWQARTRQIEDALSDALHDRLTRRFVDQQLMLVASAPDAPVTVDGEVVRLGSHVVGHLVGLELQVAAGGRRVWAAVRRGVSAELDRRLAELRDAPDDELVLDDAHRLSWREGVLGALERGPGPLEVTVRPGRLDMLEPAQKELVRRRLRAWVDARLAEALEPLRKKGHADLKGPAKGLAYALEQGLGVARRADVREQVDALGKVERDLLARLGVRLGTDVVFATGMLRPEAQARRAWLASLNAGIASRAPPPGARPSVPVGPGEARFLEALGYRVFGGLAVRVDVSERVAAEIRGWARARAPVRIEPIAQWMGCRVADAAEVVAGLGYRLVDAGEGRSLVSQRRAPIGAR